MLQALPVLVVFLLFFLQSPVMAQALRNDGFQRRNGQMYVLRNGQTRPMRRDARLPTGVVVTKDGFVLGANGQRTELHEGQGCDLKGNPVAVVSSSAGGLALRAPARQTVARTSARKPAVEEVRAVLEDLLGRGSRAEDRDEYGEKDEEKAREQRKKEQEWQREERKRGEEYERERGKKWKEKKKKGKKWDD